MPEATPLSAEAPYQIPMLDPTQPIGFIIAGQSQAEKTTAQGLIRVELGQIDPHNEEPPAFPLSNGLRAITAEMLIGCGIDLETCGFLGKEACLEMIGPFAERMANDERGFLNRVYKYYVFPRPKRMPRNDAVDSAVPYISEDENLHPLVFRAAGRYLRTVMHAPSKAGNGDSPRAIVLDGRNAEELATMLHEAEVSLGGLFVLTCGEEKSVRRRMEGEPEKDIREAIAKQKERNHADRYDKPIGWRTTMPEDIQNIVALHEFKPGNLHAEAITRLLFAHGMLVSGSTQNAVHIATDKNGVSKENERRYLPPLVHGMVSGVQHFANH